MQTRPGGDVTTKNGRGRARAPRSARKLAQPERIRVQWVEGDPPARPMRMGRWLLFETDTDAERVAELLERAFSDFAALYLATLEDCERCLSEAA